MSPGPDRRTFRALVRFFGPDKGRPLHLIREDAETSLCGIPRAQLEPGGNSDEIVCAECIDWLPRRIEFSDANPRSEPA